MMLDLNKEREAFEAWIDSEFSEDDWYCEAASLKRIHNFQEETQSYYCGRENDMWMAWFEAKAQAVPEGYVLINEEQAKDTARLDFMLKEHRVICTDTNYDENYELTDEGFCVNEVYWIDGWDRLTKTVHKTEREAIDQAMSGAEG